MSNDYILAIDQGTTSTRAMVFDGKSNLVCVAQEEIPQIYPNPGWVEHDPEVIWRSVVSTARQALVEAEALGAHVVTIGITNQRETTVVWDRETGKPIYNAIVWQDRRTADWCKHLINDNLAESVRLRTGLLIDPYFSATKVAWILDNVPGARERAEAGKLAFGTIDSFLISRFTHGERHVTDATNAARTNLFNIVDQEWDTELMRYFRVPEPVLPEVLDCAAEFGSTAPEIFGRSLPITGVAGDQHAATIGQCCFVPGSIKSTYGTGCFVMINSGEKAISSHNNLLTTVAYRLNGQTTYALEGSIFVAGAAVKWLRDGLGFLHTAAESEVLAKEVPLHHGTYLVPAFVGLGAPYWNPDVRGAVFGLTPATGPAEITRAALESVCYQTYDLFSAMEADGIKPVDLKIDGGMVANNWLCQFLSDTLDMPIHRPRVMETTALGAAYLAGLQTGIFDSLETLEEQWNIDQRFEPEMPSDDRKRLLDGWHDAVYRVIR